MDKGLLKWFTARDVFLGLNAHKQNIGEGLRLAADCDHEEARQLCKIFSDWSDGVINSEGMECDFLLPPAPQRAKGYFREADGLSLCFAGLVSKRDDKLLLESAKLGYALAQAQVAESSMSQSEKFEWATLSARQGEPMGFHVLGDCYDEGYGCERNREQAQRLFKCSAELGFVQGQYAYSMSLGISDPAHFFWIGKVAQKGKNFAASVFISGAMKVLDAFFLQNEGAPVVFQIGASLKGNIGPQFSDITRPRGAVFGFSVDYASAERVRQAISMFDEWCDKARLAIRCWALVAKRLHICKDVRTMISKLVWERRVDADYKLAISFLPID